MLDRLAAARENGLTHGRYDDLMGIFLSVFPRPISSERQCAPICCQRISDIGSAEGERERDASEGKSTPSLPTHQLTNTPPHPTPCRPRRILVVTEIPSTGRKPPLHTLHIPDLVHDLIAGNQISITSRSSSSRNILTWSKPESTHPPPCQVKLYASIIHNQEDLWGSSQQTAVVGYSCERRDQATYSTTSASFLETTASRPPYMIDNGYTTQRVSREHLRLFMRCVFKASWQRERYPLSRPAPSSTAANPQPDIFLSP